MKFKLAIFLVLMAMAAPKAGIAGEFVDELDRSFSIVDFLFGWR